MLWSTAAHQLRLVDAGWRQHGRGVLVLGLDSIWYLGYGRVLGITVSMLGLGLWILRGLTSWGLGTYSPHEGDKPWSSSCCAGEECVGWVRFACGPDGESPLWRRAETSCPEIGRRADSGWLGSGSSGLARKKQGISLASYLKGLCYRNCDMISNMTKRIWITWVTNTITLTTVNRMS